MSIAQCATRAPQEHIEDGAVDIVALLRHDAVEAVRHEVARQHPIRVTQRDDLDYRHVVITASAPVMDAEFLRDLYWLVHAAQGRDTDPRDLEQAITGMTRVLALAKDAGA